MNNKPVQNIKIEDTPVVSFSADEAELYLGVSRQQLQDWSDRGLIRYEQTAKGNRRYSKNEMDRFVKWHGYGAGNGDVYSKVNKMRLFADLSEKMLEKMNPEEAIKLIFLEMMNSTGCTTASISLFDEVSNSLTTMIEFNIDGTEMISEDPYFLHEYPASERVIRKQERQLINISDQKSDSAERDLLERFGEKSVLILPLVYNKMSLGVVELFDTFHERNYLPEELAFLDEMCGLIALSINKTQNVKRIETRNRVIRLFLNTADLMASAMDLETSLSIFVQNITEVFNASWSELYTYHRDREEFKRVAYYQIPEIEKIMPLTGIAVRLPDDKLLSNCLKSRESATYYLDDPELEQLLIERLTERKEKAVLIVPLIYGETDIGILKVVESRYLKRFTEGDRRLVSAAAKHAAVVIYNMQLLNETKQRNAELSTVLDVAETVTSTVDIQSVLKSLSEKLCEVINVFSTEIYYFNQNRQQFERVAETADTKTGESRTGIYKAGDVPEFDRCINKKTPVSSYIDDPALDKKTRQEMIRWGEKSNLCVPMFYKNQIIGITCLTEVGFIRRFSEADIRLVSGIVAQGAAAIENAQAYTREQTERARLVKLNKRLSALVELSGQMRGLISQDHLISILARVMSEAMEFRRWIAYIFDPDKLSFQIAATYGSSNAAKLKNSNHVIPTAIFEGLISDATMISHSYFIDHMNHTWDDDERFHIPMENLTPMGDSEWHHDDLLIIPMIGEKGQLLGYIAAYDPADKKRPTHEIVRLMEVFTGKIASSIELERLHEQLSRQAVTDGLTGLFNHRFLHERIVEEAAKAERYQTPLSVLMIDLDNFKKYNDTYGHPQGDKLLKGITRILLAGTRLKVDVVARYGGEEFFIILPSTPADEAMVIAERLRISTEHQLFEGNPGQYDVKITLSIGIATLPDHTETASGLVSKSDKALYEAKETGKNRVCLYGAGA
ncbi:MAG: diguanylate cyclase [Desulfobacterales bacterium]|nr:diguanylate cyclase [Desulfobacterales bacterium]